MRHIVPILLLCAMMVAARGAMCAVPGAVMPAAPEAMVSLDFESVDIRLLVKYISELTGRNFIVDEKLSGTVTIVGPRQVPLSEVYAVFQSILELRGFAAVESNALTRIVSRKDVQQENVSVSIGREVDEADLESVRTQIITLNYLNASEAVSLLAPLKTNHTSILVSATANSLIITDTGRSIARLLHVLQELDSDEHKAEATFLPLRFASAVRLRADLESLAQSMAKPGRKIRVFSDDRINSLVIVANSADTDFLRRLVTKLDSEASAADSQIHIYTVKNTNAADLAEVLSKTFAEVKGRVDANIPIERARPTIVADRNTNSLIITASPQEYASLRAIIDQLDIQTRQVLVEALIAEVGLDATSQLGIEWAESFGDYGNRQAFGGTNFGLRAESISGNLYGMGVGLMNENNIAAILHAYQNNASVNILSTPHILSNDNQEAEISIGQVVPILKDSRISEQETVIRTFEYKDVGIKLRITPHVNPDGFVRLEIYKEIQKLLDTTLYEAPLLTKRQAKTVVTVRNGRTIVIGGLIRDDKSEGVKKVPLLGDIPLLGWAFKRKVQTTEKTNLLIFITPHIISADADEPLPLAREHENSALRSAVSLNTEMRAARHADSP